MSDAKDINPFPETDPDAPKDMPPLTVMSLSLRTVVNHKENKREVVCATARIWTNSESFLFITIFFWFSGFYATMITCMLTFAHHKLPIAPWLVMGYPARIDDSTPPESLPCSVHTFVRPLDRFPPNFESRAKTSSKGFISPVGNEKSLLNCLLGASCISFLLALRGHKLITLFHPPTVSTPL